MLPVALNQIGHDSATNDRWTAARDEYEEGVRLAREAVQPNELCACLAGLSRLEGQPVQRTRIAPEACVSAGTARTATASRG
jgi:hypothetical protein